MFTRVNLTIDAPSDSIVSSSASNQIVTRDVEKDPVQTQLISKYGPLSKPVADRVVGRATATISRMENRAGESALGDVIADAQLLSAKETIKGGAAVAFMNPGGIRAEIVVGRTTTDGGAEVTYGQLFGIHPFSNVVTGLTLLLIVDVRGVTFYVAWELIVLALVTEGAATRVTGGAPAVAPAPERGRPRGERCSPRSRRLGSA